MLISWSPIIFFTEIEFLIQGNASGDIEILEQDKYIAVASLDMPAFGQHTSMASF